MTEIMIWEYIATLEWIMMTLFPAIVILTGACWFLAYRYWPYKLPLVFAIKCTIVSVCVGWLSYTVWYRKTFGPLPIEYHAVTATMVLTLIVIPFLSVGYLLWLNRARRSANGRRRHTDEGHQE